MTEKITYSYFVGIGGIGMSAIARYFNFLGIQVGGYDRTETVLTKELIKEGMDIHYEDNIQHIPNWITNNCNEKTLIVYTPAIPKNNKELNYFNEKKFTLLKRSEVLGKISKDKFTIAVAGTHGKTTTSCMITHLLKTSGIDCTAFLGGISVNYQSNFVFGKSDVMVVEADEFDRSFLKLNPSIAVITSTDADHLDIYSTSDLLEEAYRQFAKKIKPDGKLIVKKGLNIPSKYKYYLSKNELKQTKSGSDFMGFVNEQKGTEFHFDYYSEIENIFNITCGIPGYHNVENAIAALAVSQFMGSEASVLKSGLSTFFGVKRRFEIKVQRANLALIDDYAHHPAEIEALLTSVKAMYRGKKVTIIFQPHLFSRTKDFAKEFSNALSLADEVILTEIYPAREEPIAGISSEIILSGITSKEKMICNKNRLLELITEKKKNLEVVLTVGAGDIDQYVDSIKKVLTE